MKKNQNGFTLVEGLLAIIAVAIVGFVGFYVYNANKNVDQNNAAQSKSADTAKDAIKTDAKEEKTKNLVIKELGIQFTLPDDLSGLTYDLESATSVQFKDEQFSKLVAACSNPGSDTKPYVGILTSYEGVYDANAMSPNVFQDFVKQLPGSYLMYGGLDGGYCQGESVTEAQRSAVTARFNSVTELLKKAIADATKPQ